MGTPYIACGASQRRVTLRRAALVAFVAAATVLATATMADLLWGAPLRGWNIVVLVMFAFLFFLLALGAALAVFGFLATRGGGDPLTVEASLSPGGEDSIPLPLTAIVLPIYNEDVKRVFAGLRAMFHSLQRTGSLDAFHFFVLSDSTDPDTWVAEEAAWFQTLRLTGARGRVFYRHRKSNTNHKAGNIADFCRRWGRRYRHMVVLDADSVMTGPAFVHLVRLMERNPRVALIQTTPILVRAQSLFARVHQFSTRLYGPLFIAGVNYWQQGEGNYWGHNAIIRVEPFMRHCALPSLPGRRPLGGRVLSHDFVEAALLRRAGWASWMLPLGAASAEECPPTLIDYARRDHRWCQGNLQHAWLLFARGLGASSRIHFALGILSYGSSLVWLAFLVLSTLLMLGFHRTGLTWIPEPGLGASLGITPAAQSLGLLAFTFALMFTPKILAVADLFLRPGDGAAAFGGRARTLASIALETLFAGLAAPVLMLFHAKFVLLTLLGRSVGWPKQRRDGGSGTSWQESWVAHRVHTIVGVAWLVVLYFWVPTILGWMLPVLAGLILSVPLSVLSSRSSAGAQTRAWGLFRTPEEIAPTPELHEIDGAVATSEAAPGVVDVIVDPRIHAVHRGLLHPRRAQAARLRPDFPGWCESLLLRGASSLTTAELMSLLSDIESVDWLHREVHFRPPQSLAPCWRTALESAAARAVARTSDVTAVA